MVHGLLGLGRLHSDGSTKRGYWANVPAVLTAAGNRVFVPRLPAASSVATRAAELKAFLDRELPEGQFHLLAHSMGGLDSRYLISRLDMAERVLTLTTLGTPHRGTAFADWGVRVVQPLVRPMLDFLGLPYEAFRDLTTTGCASSTKRRRMRPMSATFPWRDSSRSTGSYSSGGCRIRLSNAKRGRMTVWCRWRRRAGARRSRSGRPITPACSIAP